MAETKRTFRKPLKIAGIALAILIAALLLVVFVLPKTAPGQGLIDRFARPVIEEQVRAQLGSEIDFDRIGGALPGELVLTDIVLSEGGEPWLSVDRVRLEWSPLALLRGDIVVDSLVVTEADLRRQPPPRPEQPEPEDEEESGPLDLPSITIGRFVVEPLRLREPVLGTPYVLDLSAALAAEGQAIDAEARVATASGSDEIVADIDFDTDHLEALVTVSGREDGLVATLSGAGGPVDIRLDGRGPLDAWQGRLAAAVGAYGGANASLTGDLAGLSAASLEGTLTPGPGLPPIAGQVVGDELALSVETARDGEAVLIGIDRIEGRFGALGGEVRLASTAAEAVSASLSGTISRPVAEEFGATFAAGPVALQADAAREGDGWRASGELTLERLVVTLTDGRTGGDTLFSGQVGLRSPGGLAIGQDRLDPILAGGATARATVSYPAEGPLTLSGIEAQLGRDTRQVTASGQASFDPETSRFDTRLQARARRAALEILLGAGSYDGPLDLRLRASGTPDDADVDLTASLPSGMLDGVAFSSGRLTADLEGLPSAPAGEARLTSEGGDYQGRIVARREGPAIRIPALSFSSGGISLDGEGLVNPETRAVDARLALDAGQSATLITGQTIGGQADIIAKLGADGGPVDIRVTAQDLAFEGNTAETLTVTAQGPLSAVAFDVDGSAIAAADYFLPFLRTSGTADVATPDRVIELAAFETALESDDEDDRITLLSPTRIELGEVVAISETRIDWLGEGRIVAEGRYARDLWVANISAEDIAVPGQPILASLTAVVDSREAEIATFDARARTTDDEVGAIYAVVAEGRWADGRFAAEANLAPEGQSPFGEAVVAFPLVLTRTDGSLGVSMPDEGLEGRITYASALAPLYAFAGLATEPLSGRLDADVTLGGALSAPEARGTARLSEGRFEEERFGFALSDIGLDAQFAYSGTETVVTLTGAATDADGDADAVGIDGDVRIGADSSAVDVTVALNDAQLSDSAALELRTGGELRLTGPLDELLFAGTVRIDELDAAIPDLSGEEAGPEYVPVEVVRMDAPQEDRVGELAEPAPPPFKVALDLSIEANNAVFVRGRGLDSEWRIDMTVGGTTIQPVIGGEIALLEGTFDFAGRTFDITQGVVDFQRGTEINPRLNVEAQYEADEVTAIIRVTGPAQSPEIELDSNPPMPQEDVMALILFGKQPTELTALESLQIANAVAKLTGTSPLGGGGPGITDKLRSSLGLDALSLGVGADGNATVGIGKYVTDDIYVSARQSAGDVGTEVIVTYEVTDDVTVESALKPDGAQAVSANYKRDY